MRPSLALLCLLAAPALLSAQDSTNPALTRMAGCTLQEHTYLCSKADLQHALSLTRTITYLSQPASITPATPPSLTSSSTSAKSPPPVTPPPTSPSSLSPCRRPACRSAPAPSTSPASVSFSLHPPAFRVSCCGYRPSTEIPACPGPPSLAPPPSRYAINSTLTSPTNLRSRQRFIVYSHLCRNPPVAFSYSYTDSSATRRP